ncbi:membrane protein, partial [Streptomyces coelicoflavus ZG0656]
PRFEVVEAVAVRADCPASTALYVRLGGTRPVGCARPL